MVPVYKDKNRVRKSNEECPDDASQLCVISEIRVGFTKVSVMLATLRR